MAVSFGLTASLNSAEKPLSFALWTFIGWAISPSLARLNLSIFWPVLYLYISVSLPLFLPRLRVSVLVYPLVFFCCFFPQETPHFITFFLRSSCGQNTYLYRMIWSLGYKVLQGPWEWHFLRLISLSVRWPAFVSVFGGFCFPLFVFRVARQQRYLCFAHLSPHYLLCHGTVNVSDRDRSRWKSTPSFVLCLFCYPSLTRFLFISGRRAGPGLYLVAKFTHWKGRKASNKQLRYS